MVVLRLSAQSNLEFIENKGQWDPAVKFKADIPTGAFFLHPKGFTVLLQSEDDLKKIRSLHGHGANQTVGVPGTSLPVQSAPAAVVAPGTGPLPGPSTTVPR